MHTNPPTGDPLTLDSLLPHLSSTTNPHDIHIYPSIDSTNTSAKALAANDAPHGTIVIANHQADGKGRHDRKFHSPAGTGIYMSLLLHPRRLPLVDPSLTTLIAAVAIRRAILKICGKPTKIKWTNDIMLHEKKIGGILTESTTGPDGNIANIILGIGLNITTRNFPHDLAEKSGSIYKAEEDAPPTRARLAAEITNTLMHHQIWENPETTLQEYRENMAYLGDLVHVTEQNSHYTAKILGLDDNGHLIIETLTKHKKHLISAVIRPLP